MEKGRFFSRSSFWTSFALVVLFGMLGAANVIFGWTNPSGNPPSSSGAISATGGNVSINGTLDMLTHRIFGVAAPTDGNDAANKSYVDAQTGGGGKQPASTITLFGVASYAQLPAGSALFRGPNGGVPPGCRAPSDGSPQYWNTSCATLTSSWGNQPVGTYPAAGTGSPSCSTLNVNLTTASSTARKGDWLEILTGYGPHETISLSYVSTEGGAADPNHFNPLEMFVAGNPDFQEDDIPSTGVSISDSVCSSSPYQHVMVTRTARGVANGVVINSGYNSACSAIGCNTCRICQWAPY